MLPEYRAWIEGILAADNGVGTGFAADVLPTIMVWAIDIADYDYALTLAEFVLRHRVALPKRYERDAATLIVEEIADQAIRSQNGDQRFPVEILERTHELTWAADIHDQVRAKLLKAIGVELVVKNLLLGVVLVRESLAFEALVPVFAFSLFQMPMGIGLLVAWRLLARTGLVAGPEPRAPSAPA